MLVMPNVCLALLTYFCIPRFSDPLEPVIVAFVCIVERDNEGRIGSCLFCHPAMPGDTANFDNSASRSVCFQARLPFGKRLMLTALQDKDREHQTIGNCRV